MYLSNAAIIQTVFALPLLDLYSGPMANALTVVADFHALRVDLVFQRARSYPEQNLSNIVAE